jgi:glutathione S-transferase
MKLCFFQQSRATRARWMLEELGIPYKLVPVDMGKGERLTAVTKGRAAAMRQIATTRRWFVLAESLARSAVVLSSRAARA